MRARSLMPLVLGVLCLAALGPGQVQKAVFDGPAAREYVRALSADAMEGRKSGERGDAWAAAYIVSQLRGWGLEPAGPGGDYFQDMTYEYFEVQRGAALEIIAHGKARPFVVDEDWRAYRYSGSAAAGAGIVFVGYGIAAPEKQYDDYAGVDVKDKLVLFAVETPARFAAWPAGATRLEGRIRAARARGARGVLTFRSDGQAALGTARGGLGRGIYQADFPLLMLESKVVDFIFKWQKADPRYFFQQINLTGKPQSYDLGVQALVGLQTVYDEKRPTRNILARISGADARLKSEYVVVGAHMDHLGIDLAGDVLNGADDNASGTAVVMEAARALKRAGFKPRRTIVFALWAAEEEGLLGSKFYTEHPVYPLEKTVANINLDMEGHGTGKVRASGAYFAPEVWDILKAGLPKDILDNTVPGRGGPGGSDHTHFLYNGVPAFMVGTDGSHFKTNRVGDVIDLIKPEILKASGDFVLAALNVLAMEPKVPILPKRRETFSWRYATIVNQTFPDLKEFIEKRKDVVDPDVDIQFALVGRPEGSSGDLLRAGIMKALLAGVDELSRSRGLQVQGGPAAAGGMMGMRGPAKTSVLLGLRGTDAIRDDLRFAEAFAKLGLQYVLLDRPDALFQGPALSREGRDVLDALAKAGLLPVVQGLDDAQAKALLEAIRKPVFLRAPALPGNDVLELIKKTGSTLGLVLGKSEDPAAYVQRVESGRKALGSSNLAVVGESCLWSDAGRASMIGVIGGLLQAKYENNDLADLFSGSLLRILAASRT